MAANSEFTDYILDLLAPLGDVSARRMFGGGGLYFHGPMGAPRMFALLADDRLYLKADAQSRAEFEAEGMAPFQFEAKGKLRQMSYFEMPEILLEDSDLLCDWARRAVDAALRAPPPRKSAPKPGKRPPA